MELDRAILLDEEIAEVNLGLIVQNHLIVFIARRQLAHLDDPILQIAFKAVEKGFEVINAASEQFRQNELSLVSLRVGRECLCHRALFGQRLSDPFYIACCVEL
ncbi:hypothetical protein KSF_099710 [Reticulibacter mediterranei]|uniref:Uncharacterized protein n=1 Tax=Reticulibacter mediterranei TaxID=2778369 RepID=A0A8J3N8P9_9CHLR|nr:hypothetical protein KSF_099710 [Reticulibacter mediterranei]